jgi:hypothetical protein
MLLNLAIRLTVSTCFHQKNNRYNQKTAKRQIRVLRGKKAWKAPKDMNVKELKAKVMV